MKNNKRKYLTISIIMFLISIVYTILVKTIDVRPIGPNNSYVGFSYINEIFKNILTYNKAFYKISKYAGFIPFIFVCFYALVGLNELIDKKSLKKVDIRLLILGGFYVLFVLVYVLFEKLAINYRPVIVDGSLEASYPSTHTLLALLLCGSFIIMNNSMLKNNNIRKYLNLFSYILMFIIVITRFLSGVHWFSDIIGGIIISICLLSIFKTFILYLYKK
jgi:undecaprenyl-diphosphatase